MKDQKKKYDNYFRRNGYFTGNVLDIGGNWGLWREWWNSEDGSYTIIDPLVDELPIIPEFMVELYKSALTKQALSLNMIGEDINTIKKHDTVLLVSSLDHCMEPQKVVNNSANSLKSGGRMILVNSLEHDPEVKIRKISILTKIFRYAKSPRKILEKLKREKEKPQHLFHFTKNDLKEMVLKSGNMEIKNEEFIYDTGGSVAYFLDCIKK